MPVMEPARDRATEILHLLAYQKVGPLSGEAITRNLGVPAEGHVDGKSHTGDEGTDKALQTLVRAGKVVRRDDGRYAAASSIR